MTDSLAVSFLAPGLIPPRADVRSNVEILHVGFDIQQRRAVKHIHAFDRQGCPWRIISLTTESPMGIGAVWIACGEHAMFLIVQKGRNPQ